MRHLSPAEFAEAAERLLPSSRAAHLDGCDRCREQLARVRAALEAAEAVDVPEPSPLYWQHLRGNLQDRIAGESIAPSWRADSWPRVFDARILVPLGAALALVAAVIVAREHVRPLPPPAPPMTAENAVPATVDFATEPENAEAWRVLTAAAADVPFEEAHEAGMHVPPAAIDRAVQRMTPEELNALGRLLQSQLHGAGD